MLTKHFQGGNMNTNFLFKHAYVYTQNPEELYLKDAYVLVENEKIKYIGKSVPDILPESVTEINAKDILLCPGLVNAHTHTPMTFLRGYADDCNLDTWLSYIWPAEASLNENDYYWGAMLGIAEMLSYGITSFTDMYRSSASILKAAIHCGIKANICESITCRPDELPVDSVPIQKSLALIQEFQNYDNGRIILDTSIQSVLQTNPNLWEYICNEAEKYHIGIHTHICETKKEIEESLHKYGKTPIALLDSYGIFNHRTIAVHGIYISEEEINILKSSNSFVVHDPCSNLKCCCGFGNLKPFLDNNIPVALGTDGVCSNNSGDMFETMKITALNQKMLNQNPEFLSAKDIFRMATINGLLSQGRVNSSGILKEGFDADIIGLDMKHPGLNPWLSPCANLVYSAHGNHVLFTMVRGKFLYNRGEYKTIDLEKVYYHIKQSIRKLPFCQKINPINF